jgi:basic membrane protein A and related proteins
MALLTPLGATADRGLILATLAPSLYTPAPEVSINMPFQPDYDVVDERRAYTLTANPNSDSVPQRGVLIIHGFMGSPLSSRPLAEYLNTHGYFVHCPLLPGHGHYPNKLYKVPAKAWLAEVEEAYTLARANVNELFIIGHSMGNVLGAHLVLKYDDIRGMAMLAPIIDVPDRRLRWVKYARFFLPWYYPHKSKRESMQHLVRERVLDFDPSIDFDSPQFQAQLPEVSRVPYDVIVTVGFAMGEATAEAAAKYPNINFIGVDQFQGETIPNVAGLIFPEDKAGFQAGALAAMLSQSGTIAAVLGTDLVPPVVAFKEGYEGGARYINPDINLISTFHPGGLDVAFTDPEWGASTAKQAVDQGADVVFGAGGKTGNGAIIEVAGVEGAFCIGVDSDQWETVPEAHACLVSSAMKLITPGVFELAKLSQEGAFPGGNYIGATGLAPFHDFEDQISQEIKDKLAEIEAGLNDGSISTGYNPGG